MIYEGRKEDRKVEKKQISELREEEAIKRRKMRIGTGNKEIKEVRCHTDKR